MSRDSMFTTENIQAAMDTCAAASIKNFATLHRAHRERCIKVLRRILRDPLSIDAFMTWGKQVRAGVRIGSDDPRFHFGIGMQVRNALRGVLLDEDLPPVPRANGEPARNWDDYYYGALHAAVTEENG